MKQYIFFYHYFDNRKQARVYAESLQKVYELSWDTYLNIKEEIKNEVFAEQELNVTIKITNVLKLDE